MTQSRTKPFLAWLLMACAASSAQAGMIAFTLDSTDRNTGLSGAPWGDIAVIQNAGNAKAIDVFLTLRDGFVIHKTQGPTHPALAFSLKDTPEVSISFLGDNAGLFSAHGNVSGDGGDPVKAAGWGAFPYYIECDQCAPGYTDNGPRSLSFTIAPKVGTLTPQSIIANGKAYFTVDIQSARGVTGNVASTADGIAVADPEPGLSSGGSLPAGDSSLIVVIPEPGAAALLGAGLLAMARTLRRKTGPA